MLNYLLKIKGGQPINANAFIKACIGRNISESKVRAIFDIQTYSADVNNKYRFNIIDKGLYETYFAKFHESDKDGKVTAALHGNSKNAKSQCGALVYREHYQDQTAKAILFEDDTCLQYPDKCEHVLIVENANTFIKLDNHVVPNINLTDLPLVWGKGMDITGYQYLDLLKRYKAISCFFDYDLAGLKIYASLHQYLGDKLSFYIHPSFEMCLEKYGKPLTNSQFISLKNIAVDANTKIVADILIKHKKWLEQEVLQADIIKR